MYTYVQRRGCKKQNTTTYVHTGRVSNAYSRIHTARARVHGWVRTEKLHHRRVHGEPTGWVGMKCVIVFIRRAWTEQPMETRPDVPQNGGNGLVLECYGRNRGPVHREGCGVPQNGTPRDTVHLHRRPPPASTSYCLCTIDLLQPPPATVHPRAPVHPASTARYSTCYCSTSPFHGLLFNHPSTGYYSTSPPPATVHPALHGVLFIHTTTGSIDRGTGHPATTPSTTTGSCSSNPHRELFIQTPQQRSLFIKGRRQQCSIGFS